MRTIYIKYLSVASRVLTLPLLLVGCAATTPVSRPDDAASSAVPSATFEVIADRNLNPDIHGNPKPLWIRFYELKAAAAFERAGFMDLQEKDEAQLGTDFVRRDELMVMPGERRTFERKGHPDVRTFGLFAAYRDLERSTWRASIDSPNSVEMRRRWFGLGSAERLKPVHYVIILSKNSVRVQLQQEAK